MWCGSRKPTESGLEREGIYPRANLAKGTLTEDLFNVDEGADVIWVYKERGRLLKKEKAHHHNHHSRSDYNRLQLQLQTLNTTSRLLSTLQHLNTFNMKFSHVLLFATAAVAAPALVERQSQTTLVSTITDAATAFNATVQTSLTALSKTPSPKILYQLS
jgi:hypothetical protein